MYQKILELGSKFLGIHTMFKFGFNFSPMYSRSTAKIIFVSKDLLNVNIKLPISYKNKNYVNSIYGGSMFAAVDAIPMVQLINLLRKDFIVWDKSAEIKFRRPAKETLYADFSYTLEELDSIRSKVSNEKEIEICKSTLLTNKEKTKVYCEVNKIIYIADKSFYLNKKTERKSH